MSTFSRLYQVLAHFVALTFLLVLAACAEQEVPKPLPKKVKAIQIQDVTGLVERSFPGRAKAAMEGNLSFRVSGPLIEFPVSVGDQVKQGDVLARIDPNDYETRVSTMRGQLQSGMAARDLAEAEYKRAEKIKQVNPDLISDSEFDRRLGDRDQLRAKVHALEAALKSAQDDLAYTTLRAPFDGDVAATYVENFENVLAKSTVLRLLDSQKIEVVIDVPEQLISYAPYVLSATVSFDALPDVAIAASVKEVSSEASKITRTYPVTLSMDQPEGVRIKPGMAASARLVSRLPEQSREVGISIPATAVFGGDDASQTNVFVVDEATMTLQKRSIEISLPSSTGVLVKGGLNVGDWLVVAGVHSVSEGQEVRLLDAKAAEVRQ